MRKLISMMLSICMVVSMFGGISAYAQTSTQEYTAEIMEVKNGAKGMVTMTHDDGYLDAALFLNEQAKIYGLKASLMIYADRVDKSDGATWKASIQELLTEGYLDVQCHSKTHEAIPSKNWSDYDEVNSPLRNTDENFKTEIVDSKTKLEEVFPGQEILFFVPSNNTLCEDAYPYVQQNYYAARSTHNGQDGLQTLNPEIGTTSGKWHALKRLKINAAIRDEYVQQVATEGGWLITYGHSIGCGSGEVPNAETAIAWYEEISQLQKEGKIWCAGMDEAIKYIRERQNSTVKAYAKESGVAVELAMKDTTADNLPLSADIFDYPLTVKTEVPAEWSEVYYTQGSKGETVDTFEEGGKTYVYINIVPNGGIAQLSSVVADNESMQPSSFAYVESGTNAGQSFDGGKVSGPVVPKDEASTKTYVKISLEEYASGSSAYFNFTATPNGNPTLEVYGISDVALAENWSAETITYDTAPANDTYSFGVQLDKVYNGEAIATYDLSAEQNISLDIKDYATYMKGQGAEYITLVFVTPNASERIYASQDFENVTSIGSVTAKSGISAVDLIALDETGTHNNTQGGTKSIHLQSTANYNILGFLGLYDKTKAGSYEITFYLKATRTGTIWAGLYDAASSPKAWIKYESKTISEANKWTKFTYKFTFDSAEDAAKASWFGIRARDFSQTTTDPIDLYIDDVVVRELNLASVNIKPDNSSAPVTVLSEGFENSTYISITSKGGNVTDVKPDGLTSNHGVTSNTAKTGTKSAYKKYKTKDQRMHLSVFTNLDETVTTSDEGRKFPISFWYQTNVKNNMILRFYLTDGTTYTNLSSIYEVFTPSEAGTWLPYNTTLTLTDDIITSLQDGYELNIALGYHTTNPDYSATTEGCAVIYVDDVVVKEIPTGETTSAFEQVGRPTDAQVSVNAKGNNTDLLSVNGMAVTDMTKEIRKTYISFAKAEEVSKAVLKVSASTTGTEQTLKVWALVGTEMPETLTYDAAPGSLAGTGINVANVYRGLPIETIQLTNGTATPYEIDVTDYVKNSDRDNYLFAVTCDEAGADVAELTSPTLEVTKMKQIGTVTGTTCSLAGNIAVNFYVDMDETALTEYADKAYMQFTLPNGTTEKHYLKDAQQSDDKYVFTAGVAAKEMTDEVQAQLFVDDGMAGGKVNPYTVKAYAEVILKNEENNAEYAQAKELVEAMLNYGAYAQTYWNYHTDNMANDLEIDGTSIVYEASDLDTVKAEDLVSYRANLKLGNDKVKLASTSMVLKTETNLRYYFTVDESVADTVVFTDSEGAQLTSETVGAYQCITISNVSAEKLGDDYTVKATYTGGETSATYNCMAYVYDVLNNEASYDVKLTGLLKTIVLYYQAAKTF